MQDCEASDDVVSTNIDTTITPIRMGSLRLGSDTAPASKVLVGHSLKTEDCELFQVLKDNIYVLLTMISGMMMPPTGVDCASDEAASRQAEPIASQIAAVIPSRAIRRVAVIDDEGREVAATIIGD